MNQTNKKLNRDYSKFDLMSTEVLMDILRRDSELPEGEESDSEAIIYIMEVVAKRNKEQQSSAFSDVDDAWESFNKNYLPSTEDSGSLYEDEENVKTNGLLVTEPAPFRKTRHLHRFRKEILRFACAAVITIAVLFTGTITASALGFDIWGTVAKWTNETFGFTYQSSLEKEYDNALTSTLNEYYINEKVIPTWLPDGYEFDSVEVNNGSRHVTIDILYTLDESKIYVTITKKLMQITGMYEKDDNEVTVYKAGGIEHYIMTNINRRKIVWTNREYECMITGNFSVEEAEKMIDSIY